MTDILGSIELAREEAYSALDALTRAKEGKFGDDEFGAKIFELSSRADHEGWIREATKRFIIGSSKFRIAVSFVFIIGCIGVLVTGSDEGCCGNEGYFIIVIISSLVILSGSYVISHLKKGRTGQPRSWVDKRN